MALLQLLAENTVTRVQDTGGLGSQYRIHRSNWGLFSYHLFMKKLKCHSKGYNLARPNHLDFRTNFVARWQSGSQQEIWLQMTNGYGLFCLHTCRPKFPYNVKSLGSDSHFPAASPNVTFSGLPASVCQRSKQDPYCFRTVNIQKDPKSVGPGSIPADISTPTATVFKDTSKIIFVGPLIVNGNIVSRVVTHWQHFAYWCLLYLMRNCALACCLLTPIAELVYTVQ